MTEIQLSWTATQELCFSIAQTLAAYKLAEPM